MTRMMTSFKAALACLAVVSIGAVTACKPDHGHDPTKLKSHLDSSIQKVGATKEQRAKIGVISDQIIADGSGLCKANQGLPRKFSDSLLLDQPDKEWLHRTVDDKAAELTGFAHRAVDRLIEISQTLTPEQRAQLKAGYQKAHGKK